MRTTVSIALLGLAIMGGSAHAQLLGLPTAPPSSPSNPVQEGAYVVVGPTQSGNLGVAADVGRQVPVPLQATVSGDGAKPANGTVAYARLPKDANGLPQGVDVRISQTAKDGVPTYQGIQLGKQ
jgi:hypothetical protein